MKKIDYAKKYFDDIHTMMSCPFCFSAVNIKNDSLICFNNHTFDISKKGTAVLYKTSKLKKSKIYNNNLFMNRRKFINRGFYDKLYSEISSIINQINVNTILDMGSGEGSHDIKIINLLNNKKVKLIGIDLSKDGIDLSNDFIGNNYIGIVGDLNQLPFKDNTIDLILNILSPANEKEMSRVLKKDGIIIKVTPKSQYLCELRNELKINDYENELIIENKLYEKYDVLMKKEIIDSYPLDNENLKYLINMTPLMSHIDLVPSIKSITIALNIYVLRIKYDL